MAEIVGSTDTETAGPLTSNEVRLSPREWVVAGFILAGLFWLAPGVWDRCEEFAPQADYRVPASLSSDYRLVDRYFDRVAEQDKTLLVGDSVVWGHFVASNETLTHYLNGAAGEDRFANLGVSGIHPAALAGLVQHYGRDIADRNVILHCNLLWMSSPQSDLQTEKEALFNHPELVPQFVPRIPCYRATLSERLGIVIRRQVPLFGWAEHVRDAHFDETSLPRWTAKHPYANPAGAVTLELPSPDEPLKPKPDARPWMEKEDMAVHGPSWVALAESFQWRCFQRTVDTLQQRGNRVFVVIGPFNEHMLTEPSRRTYRAIRADAEAWLGKQQIAYHAFSLLPSPCYADDSHPLADGYARMAEELAASESFRRFESDR